MSRSGSVPSRCAGFLRSAQSGTSAPASLPPRQSLSVSGSMGNLTKAVLLACLACGDPARACVPGKTQSCLTPFGVDGVQSCKQDASGFADCEAPPACNAGDLHNCTCGSSAAAGTQLCKDDGSGYEACSCDGTASGSGGTGSGGSGGTSSAGSGAGSGGSAGSNSAGSAGSASMPAPAALFPNSVGNPCTADSQCAGSPLVCVKATSNTEFQLGGPQGGYCSLPCSADSDCQTIDDISACNTTLHYCVALCLPGTSNIKCGADRAQACVPIGQSTVGVCIPRCSSDAACGAGRFCDPGDTGLCVDAKPPGGKVGDPCTPATEATDCASGLCLQYPAPNNSAVVAGSFCSADCTFGLANGCGFDNVSGGVRQAGCFQARVTGGQPGDLGLCFPVCDTNADCAQAGNGWVCDPFGDVSAEQQVGRLGECVPAALATRGAGDAGPG